jgi:hypothetical protein
MDQESLVIEEVDAGAEFVSQLEKRLPVKAAFWLKPADGGDWYLYIASDQVAPGNLDPGYREVLRVAQEHPSPYLNPFRVKVIPANHPLSQAASEIHRRFPGRVATRLGNRIFGGIAVEQAYIYPAQIPAPTA